MAGDRDRVTFCGYRPQARTAGWVLHRFADVGSRSRTGDVVGGQRTPRPPRIGERAFWASEGGRTIVQAASEGGRTIVRAAPEGGRTIVQAASEHDTAVRRTCNLDAMRVSVFTASRSGGFCPGATTAAAGPPVLRARRCPGATTTPAGTALPPWISTPPPWTSTPSQCPSLRRDAPASASSSSPTSMHQHHPPHLLLTRRLQPHEVDPRRQNPPAVVAPMPLQADLPCRGGAIQ